MKMNFKSAMSILKSEATLIINVNELNAREQQVVKDIKAKIGNDVRHMRNVSTCKVPTFVVRPELIIEYFKEEEGIEITYKLSTLSFILGGAEVYEFKTDLSQF